MRHLVLLATVIAFLGCGEEFKPTKEKAKPAPARDNVTKVKTSVPYGKKVACSDIFEPTKLGDFVGDFIEMKDNTKSNAEATSVCALLRAGEQPDAPKPDDEVTAKQKMQVLGVQPGDEYCTITLNCSLPVEKKRFRDKCQQRGDDSNRDIGQYSCVHKTQRASKWAYTYKTIHSGSNCIIEVMGGPSVTDEALVQNCTKGAAESLNPEGLKKFK